MKMENEEINKWNEENKPFAIVNTEKQKLINKNYNRFKTFTMVMLIIIALGFLTIYGIRTYYPSLFQDNVIVSHICTPYTNVTLNVDCPENVCEVSQKCPDLPDLNCNCDCGG